MNEETKELMIVGQVREALSAMQNYLGCEIEVIIPTPKVLKRWEELERKYDDFYKLPLQERLYKSGMSTPSDKAQEGNI